MPAGIGQEAEYSLHWDKLPFTPKSNLEKPINLHSFGVQELKHPKETQAGENMQTPLR